MSYNNLREIFLTLPPDERTFKSNLHNDKFYIYDIIKNTYDIMKNSGEEVLDKLETNPFFSTFLNVHINLFEQNNIDVSALKDVELSNYEKWSVLMDIIITNDEINEYVTIKNNIIIYSSFECLLLLSIDFIRKGMLYPIFCYYLSNNIIFTYSIIMHESQKKQKSIIYNYIPNKKYAAYLYGYFKKITQFTKDLEANMEKQDNMDPLRLFPHILLSLIDSLYRMLNDKDTLHNRINFIFENNELSLEEEQYIKQCVTLMFDSVMNEKGEYDIHINSLLLKKLEELNNQHSKLKQQDLQYVVYRFKNDVEDIEKIYDKLKKQNKNINIMLMIVEYYKKEDKKLQENIDSAKASYNRLKRNKKLLNEDEYNAITDIMYWLNKNNSDNNQHYYYYLYLSAFHFSHYMYDQYNKLKKYNLEKYVNIFLKEIKKGKKIIDKSLND